VVLLAFAILVTLLAAGLRPDAFYVGDPGIKLISAQNAVRFPAHPLDIPLPQIGTEPTPHVEGFFAVHGDHAHAVTSELFPILCAPLLTAFGWRGLYVLPALGFIGTLAACAWLATVLDERRDAATVAILAGLGTPFLFYGLEFWEHTPALALGIGGAALLLNAARRHAERHADTGASLAAGLLMGAAILLRPEAIWFGVAVAAASRLLVQQPTWRSLAIAAAGAAIALLPLELYTVLHFGSWVPGHIGVNAGSADGLTLFARLRLGSDWLLTWPWRPGGAVRANSFWGVAPAGLLALVAIVWRTSGRERRFLAAVAALTALLVVLTAPNDGGGQWGPRYLLFVYAPLVILAADVVQQLPGRTLRTLLVVVLLAGSIWDVRAGYRQLRGTKATYGRVVDFVSRNTSHGEHIVTDVWWLDQLAAAALDGRTLLFAGEPSTGLDIVQRLSDAHLPAVTVFRSRDESSDVDAWIGRSCFAEDTREELPLRGLIAMRLRYRCR
jgi:hypothetical protein